MYWHLFYYEKIFISHSTISLRIFIFAFQHDKYIFFRPELEVLKDFKKGFPVVRGLIATTWRSGSTLTGELMNSFPGSFYSYEPLSFSFLDRIYEQENYKASTVNVLKGIFQCNFTIVQRECNFWPLTFHEFFFQKYFFQIKNTKRILIRSTAANSWPGTKLWEKFAARKEESLKQFAEIRNFWTTSAPSTPSTWWRRSGWAWSWPTT